MLDEMGLSEDLDRIAAQAAALADDDEQLTGVVPAEPAGRGRLYLCAYAGTAATRWLVLAGDGTPVRDRELVREAASIAALCELAEESAGGGELDELHSQLVALRLTDNPVGIDDAEEAVLALQRTLGSPPRLATPKFLDDVGAATRSLEQALGSNGRSPFTEAMRGGAEAVHALSADIEANYKAELR